ncbi:MAG TPA: DUF1080 domain-containing protein [Saprospiraceae bacterium]|nr:DUF1080 domain-containing protein [Saprospiraceae bacterium]
MRYFLFSLLLISFFGCSQNTESASSADWQPMFNGENLDGWTKLNGTADYSIEGSTITGTAKLNTPNTFLATDNTYGDFVMEVDVKVDTALNSGIQIRSLSTPDYKDGRVHGYQVEIDPSERAWSGGLYDEARRGWLYPLEYNKKGQKAFKNGEWNAYHIEAVGDTLRVWVNDIMTTNLVDNMTAEGFIALQVHSIGEAYKEGAQVRWRDVKIMTEDLSSVRRAPDPEVPIINTAQ